MTCGVYVGVCFSVYSELILTHSINLSYNRSTPTCPLEGDEEEEAVSDAHSTHGLRRVRVTPRMHFPSDLHA